MRTLALSCLLFFAGGATAEFSVPPLSGPVVDQANLISTATEQRLAGFLQQLRESGGTQLQVATVPDLGGLSIEEASIRITDQWKLGSAKEDNGVLLLVAAQERKVRIEVGQGREGDLPDAIASRIVHEVILPRFRQNSPDRGIIDGVLAIVHYTDPNFQQANAAPARSVKRISGGKIEPLLWLLFFLFFLLPLMGRRGRRRGISPLGAGILGGMLGHSSRGWGGGFGGGGGGSSWGGGGGGFSGGGASGGW